MMEYFIRGPGKSHSHWIPPIAICRSQNNENKTKAPWAPSSPAKITTLPPKIEHCDEYLDVKPSDTTQTLEEKYGEVQDFLGEGSVGHVRLAYKLDSERVFAVKRYQPREPLSERLSEYDFGQHQYPKGQLPEHVERKFHNQFEKESTAEYYVSFGLSHPNLVETLDLMRDATGQLCLVMEFCSLLEFVVRDKPNGSYLVREEADCFFMQIMRGFKYLHGMGITHGDAKLDNVLPPQLFNDKNESFDSRTMDVWSAGMLYYLLRRGNFMWAKAHKSDENYALFLEQRKRKDFIDFNLLGNANCAEALYSIFEPIADKRITAEQFLETPWAREVHVCEAGTRGL